jgi:hypothetical protein
MANKLKILNIQLVLSTFLAISVYISCAPTLPSTQIKSFSLATEEVTSQAVRGYELLDESTIERKIVNIANDPGADIDDNSFQGILNYDKDLTVRLKMISLLRDYAKGLGELSTANFSEDIDKASKDLYGALAGLKETLEASGKGIGISKDNLSIIATAVNAIGKTIVEKKRREAIKAIVKNSDPAVQKSADLLEEEIPSFGDFVKDNYLTVATDYTDAYQSRAEQLTFEERMESIKTIQQLYNRAEAARGFYNQFRIAAGKLGEAHSSLKSAVEKDQFSSAELAEQIGDLVDLAKSIKNFNRSLSEN